MQYLIPSVDGLCEVMLCCNCVAKRNSGVIFRTCLLTDMPYRDTALVAVYDTESVVHEDIAHGGQGTGE